MAAHTRANGFKVAEQLISPYVNRETIQQLRAGLMGAYNDHGAAQISGYHDDKYYGPDYILVTRIGPHGTGEDCFYVFKLKEVYDHIRSGQQSMF